MRKVRFNLLLAGLVLCLPSVVFAASNGEIQQFTRDTLGTFLGFAVVSASLFLILGAYRYMTSSGNPLALEDAKKTIKNALIGLSIIAAAAVISSLLSSALTEPVTGSLSSPLTLTPIEPSPPDNSLVQVLLDAISGFLRSIVQSATKPILDGVVGFLTTTPHLASNSVVFNFWLIMVGITDSLFALVIALLGLHVMSASTFGFEEVTLKELFPRIGLAFLAANTSIFLIDWVLLLCNTLVHAVLSATGGIEHAWIMTAFNPVSIISGGTLLVTLIFMVVFLLLAVALLLFYISRLMLLAIGAVLSPIVCLLWLLPNMSDMAEKAAKAYLITIFSIFMHIVIIQLASGFLTMPGQVGANPIISILVGIALFSILLKSTTVTIHLALASQATGTFKKFGSQLLNTLSPAPISAVSRARKVIK
jgi:hypothetical protein